jgi:hypothetical protein
MIVAKYSSASGAQGIEDSDADKPCIMVKTVSGTPSWVVVYQGSPDFVNWTTMQTHDSATNASGETVFPGTERYPCKFRRVYCVSLSGGTIEVWAWAS